MRNVVCGACEEYGLEGRGRDRQAIEGRYE
jgi:hypothetical protein